MPALVRVNRDGSHVTKLTAGHLWAPACSADGQFVFYVTTEQPQRIWRVPIDVGTPEKIADVEPLAKNFPSLSVDKPIASDAALSLLVEGMEPVSLFSRNINVLILNCGSIALKGILCFERNRTEASPARADLRPNS